VPAFPWNQADQTARDFQKRAAAAGIPITFHTYEGYLSVLFRIDVMRRAAPDIGRAKIHRMLQAYKGRIGGIDLDFTRDVWALALRKDIF
jgi:hypothetical protein